MSAHGRTPRRRESCMFGRDNCGRCAQADSVGLDIGGLDERPPFVDFCLLKVGKRVGRLPAAWKYLLPKLVESLTYRGVSQGRHDGGIEFCNDVLGRASG